MISRPSIIITALVMLTVAFTVTARRQSTISSGLKATTVTTANKEIATNPADTIHDPDTAAIIISGFDKPLESRRESFFVTNLTGRHLINLTIRFTYRDVKGRQLHEATHTIACDIPSGGTRQMSVPSWDRQQSFYYIHGRTPRRLSTPFTVTHTILQATVPKSPQP